jgi:small multidrug resistance pump
MIRWLAFVGAIVSEVSASLSLQAALESPGWYLVTAGGYVLSFVLLTSLIGRGVPLGAVYGIWGAAGVALTAILASVLFDEPFRPPMALGIGSIIFGVIAIEIGSREVIADVEL